MDSRTKKIEQDLNSFVSVQRELQELMKEHHKKAWNVKDAGFDVSYANNIYFANGLCCYQSCRDN